MSRAGGGKKRGKEGNDRKKASTECGRKEGRKEGRGHEGKKEA